MVIHTSTSMNGEKPPFFERRRPPFNRRRMTFLMLPDDLILNCLARVSRLHYPTLSLVSKRFRSILASTELYQTRTLLGRTESCLYVCLQFGYNSNPVRWFTICRRPNSSNIGLVPISYPNSPSPYGSAVAIVVGHTIYVIGGFINRKISSSVIVIDCRSHTTHETSSMQIARAFPSVCVLDGKIYVTGGNHNLDSTNWIEVFDTKTQTWEFLSIPSEELCGSFAYYSVGYEGTIYVKSEEKNNGTYKLNKGKWRMADLAIDMVWSSAYCVINNILYCYRETSNISWYNPKERLWKTLKGLQRLPTYGLVKLADYGGKMAVLWEEYVPVKSLENKKIWCAQITIERCQKGKLRGTLDWIDVVVVSSTNEEPYRLVHVLATNI